ncbi:FAD-dependent oxidoreductase [Gordonia sp. NPDC003376]
MDCHTSDHPIVVIGGGISGLAAAYRLTQRGERVVLLEAGDVLGGLGVEGSIGGYPIERFYHCIMPTDDALLAIVDELGLGSTIRWTSTTMGMVVDRTRYPFNSPMDLLRFRALTFPQRVRFGAATLALPRLGRRIDLDRTRTADWLMSAYGEQIWDRLLQPMFGAKFGDAFGEVPARYLHERLGRESNVAIRGHPEGGYRAIVAALREAIVAGGGTVEVSRPVRHIADTGDAVEVTDDLGTITASSVISTIPIPLLRRVSDPDLAGRLPTGDIRYQGVVNAAILLRRPLDGHYWTPVVHSGTDFDGVIEMSALTGTRRFDGRTLVYVMKYCDRDSDLFRADPAELGRRWAGQLCRLYPDRVTAEDICAVEVFAAPFVEPVPQVGTTGIRRPTHVQGTRVHLATTAHLYPRVNSWNSAVGFADGVVTAIPATVLLDGAARGRGGHGGRGDVVRGHGQ